MTEALPGQTGEQEAWQKAELACRQIFDAVSVIERSSPAVLREIRDNLEIEIMIDRVGGPRRRLLRLVSEYCDRRIREKERDPGARSAAAFPGALRALMPGRNKPAVPPGRAS